MPDLEAGPKHLNVALQHRMTVAIKRPMPPLTLVGTIHHDPKGLPRLTGILERESPEIVTLEMSEYGVSFRERHAPRLRDRVFSILQRLREEATNQHGEEIKGSQTSLEIGAIQGILLTLELPFEFVAVNAYCARNRIPFRCIDLSHYSRDKLKRLEEEMITEENMRKIVAFSPMDTQEKLRGQRLLAQRLLLKRADHLLIKAFLDGRNGDGIILRDRYMSYRIREILRTGGKVLHVGGWEHLLDAPEGKTLYGRLKDFKPKRIPSL
jgi:hypothetical protein